MNRVSKGQGKKQADGFLLQGYIIRNSTFALKVDSFIASLLLVFFYN